MRLRRPDKPEVNKTVLDREFRRNNLRCSHCRPGKLDNDQRHKPKTRCRDKKYWVLWIDAD